MKLRLFLLTALLLVLAAPAWAQAPAPRAYERGVTLLESGDTVAALAAFRAAVVERDDYGPAWLRLGALLTARAGEAEMVFEDRVEAERALERAIELMPDDPMALLEYGLLLRKQNVRVDARRVLDRAWSAAGRADEDLPPLERARLHYTLATIYESWWEDWQGLVMLPSTSIGQLGCSNLSSALATYDSPPELPHWYASIYCPENWADQFEAAVPLAGLKDDDRERMLEHYRLALRADPAHADAAVRLLGHLADSGAWDEYEEVARRLLIVLPDDARSHMFLGLGMHRRGRSAEADAAFARAVELLPEEERHVFADISPLLRKSIGERYAELDSAARAETERMFFASTDPLYLTESNERRLEHYARLAWAELKYAAPTSGLRGWESDRGRIRVRYGEPWREYQCCYGAVGARGKEDLGNRYVYWSYGREGPLFVFRRMLTYRKARFTEPAELLAENLAVTAPESYSPATVSAIHALPHQVARFRGSSPELVRVEVYAEPPLADLSAEAGDTLETGMFLFDPELRPLWKRTQAAPVGERRLALTYALELPAGRYRYGLEARQEGEDSVIRPLARERAELTTSAFAAGALSVSDLLLADLIAARAPGVTRRSELTIAPSRDLTFVDGEPVHLYFEIYGLSTDDDGLVRYRAELAVADSTDRNVAQRVLRGVEQLFGGTTPPTEVEWERTAEPAGDIVVEYLSIELGDLEAGEYVVRVRIEDALTGEAAESRRRFSVAELDGE